MARVTFATAFGHPLGPQQRLTSVFVPYRRAVPPILFDLAFVSDFASFGAAEGRIYLSSAQRRSNGQSDICYSFWASIGSTTKADINVCSLSSRHATHSFDLAFVTSASDFARLGAFTKFINSSALDFKRDCCPLAFVLKKSAGVE